MLRFSVRLFSGLLPVAVLAAGAWYLSSHPDVGLAVGAVAAGGVVAALGVYRHRVLAARRRRRALGDLLVLTPAEFEATVAGLLRSSGFRRLSLSGGPADLGADIVGVDRRGRSVVVQCKRHAPGIAVGSPVVQGLLGALTHHGADRGILVTTSRFTAPAAELAQAHGIELIDGESLVRLAKGG